MARRAVLSVRIACLLLIAAASAARGMWVPDGIVVGSYLQPNLVLVGPSHVSDEAGGSITVWVDSRNGHWNIITQRTGADGRDVWKTGGISLSPQAFTQREPAIAADGAGGAIVTWRDYRTGYAEIYAQRLDASGSAQWAAEGVRLCSSSGNPSSPRIVSDGAGGAVVVWSDSRAGSGTDDLYAQLVGATGTVQWTADGVPLCTATGTQSAHQVVSDGGGGAIVAWADARGGSSTDDIYVQRVGSAGAIKWTADGVALCTATGLQGFPRIAADVWGGAIVSWTDSRSGNKDIYARRVNSKGAAQWTADGVPLCTDGALQDASRIVSDGAEGAFVVWTDARNAATGYDLYAQYVDGLGAVQWAADGIPLCTAAGDQGGQRIASDGAGGAILAWLDYRSGSSYYLYGQRIDATGTIQWTADGALLCQAVAYGGSLEITTDGAGETIATWHDYRGGPALKLFAQKTDPAGAARWGASGVPVCALAVDQMDPVAVADGSGGTIVAWAELRNAVDFDIYVQAVDAAGARRWAADGVALCRAAGDQSSPVITADGVGGALIVWRDKRNGGDDVYAQRIDSTGAARWTIDGVPLCTAAGTQFLATIDSDGHGGAIAAWQDARNGNYDIYAQRIDLTGAVRWAADGVPLCTAIGIQEQPRIAADGDNGAIVAWADTRAGPAADIYVQRIDAAGSVSWAADGIPLCTTATDQQKPVIAADGAGGAIVAWQDARNGYDDVYAQRVDAAGTIRWSADGLALCTAAGRQSDPQIVSDGAGGAIVTWGDLRSGLFGDIYAQRADATGTLRWVSDGAAICTAAQSQNYPQLTPDGMGGAIVTWTDERLDNNDIFAQRVEASGSVQWAADGVPLCTDANNQYSPRIASDQANGAFVVWLDPRGNRTELYLQRATDVGLGPVCEIAPEVLEIPGPLPVGAAVDTSFTITNIGLGMLVGYVEEACDHFEIVSGGGSYGLESGQSRVVTVRFEPAAAGVHECVIETGMYLCSDVVISGAAYACPPDSVLYVDALATGANDGTSWTDAFVDLQDALERADLCGNAGQIWVAAGTYRPADRNASFRLRDGLAIYGGFAGVEAELSERDLAVNRTVLSGDIGVPDYPLDNVLHVLSGSGTGGTAVIDGFTVQDGTANTRFQESGAGMVNDGGSPTLRNLIFRDNRASFFGGGIYNRNGSAPTLVNVVFCGNSAADLGGGLYNDASSPTLVNVTFSGNRAEAGGGGLCNENGSNPQLKNVVMWGDSTASMVLPEIANLNLSSPVIAYSLIQDCGDSGAGWEAAFGIDGGDNSGQDAGFVDGPGGDLHLLAGSFAVDSGDNFAAGLPATDLDGNPRIQGPAVDRGAYEGEHTLVRVAVETNPPNLEVTVDGATYAAPFVLDTRSGRRLEIGTATPQIQGETLYSFAGWSDAGDLVHEVTVPDTDITYTAAFTWAAACALIDSIVDVPADQGGWARVFFRRSHYDDPAETELPIARYDLHRRIDDPALLALVLAKAAGSTGRLLVDGRVFVVPSVEAAAAPPGLWEVVGTVSATQQEQYICLAPTLADSAATIPYTAFYVSAHSTTPGTFFDSPPDSGYSVDNIAPGVPTGMTVAYDYVEGNLVSWDPSPEADFQYFRVYRGNDADFVPGPGTLVHETAATAWTDPAFAGGGVFYKVSALDHVGNESAATAPGEVSGTDPAEIPLLFGLHQNVPNPFNPLTTLRFDLPTPVHVKLSVYNLRGERVATVLDRRLPAGKKRIDWRGVDDRGNQLPSGVYFYRLAAGDFVQTRKMLLLR